MNTENVNQSKIIYIISVIVALLNADNLKVTPIKKSRSGTGQPTSLAKKVNGINIQFYHPEYNIPASCSISKGIIYGNH